MTKETNQRIQKKVSSFIIHQTIKLIQKSNFLFNLSVSYLMIGKKKEEKPLFDTTNICFSK